MSRKYVITATCFDKRGRVLASATNSYKDSSAFMRYWAVKTGYPYKVYNHAELACLQKALKLGKQIDKILVMRYDSQGNLKNAKPCEICMACITDLKIKHVLYSTEDGVVEL
jgi:tRNA(Arg) A34 adenosine deaminase TadA